MVRSNIYHTRIVYFKIIRQIIIPTIKSITSTCWSWQFAIRTIVCYSFTSSRCCTTICIKCYCVCISCPTCIQCLCGCNCYLSSRFNLTTTSFCGIPTGKCVTCTCWCWQCTICTIVCYSCICSRCCTTVCIKCYCVCISCPTCIQCLCGCNCYLSSRFNLTTTSFCGIPTGKCVTCTCWCWQCTICTIVCYSCICSRCCTTVCIKCYCVCISCPMCIQSMRRCCFNNSFTSYFCATSFSCVPAIKCITITICSRQCTIFTIICYIHLTIIRAKSTTICIKCYFINIRRPFCIQCMVRSNIYHTRIVYF